MLGVQRQPQSLARREHGRTIPFATFQPDHLLKCTIALVQYEGSLKTA